jgi:hypothetical protein
VRRILRDKLKVHFGKPYPRDYRCTNPLYAALQILSRG